MIERLVGECVKKHSMGIIIDVNGVGYGVEVTPVTNIKITEGQDLTLWIYTHMNEDSTRFFGFLTHEERQIFAMLLGVNRLGPKIALAIIGTFSTIQLIEMIEQENAVMLSQVPGIGIQSAKKFLLELKPRLNRSSLKPLAWDAKLESVPVAQGHQSINSLRSLILDVKSALQNLGYKEREILPIVHNLENEYQSVGSPDDIKFENLLRMAINRLNRHQSASDKSEISLF
jgi:Holliday junction DNA helicase RuvA